MIALLSTILPIVATGLLLGLLILNLYLKIRRKFPINVNCWFCNSWTKVSYDDRNSFECPTCSQYNGFTEDGGYNKIISQQHDELMNGSKIGKKTKSVVTNGLCALCNNNQQLKIFQLAHFVPMREENYDQEIEHFQAQLEKAYKLCKKCDRVLKTTINKQNAWIFGNRLKAMCSKLSNINEIPMKKKMELLPKLETFLSLLFVLTTTLTILGNVKSLLTFVPQQYLPIYNDFISYTNTAINLEPYLQKNWKVEPYFIVTLSSLIYNIGKLFFIEINTTRMNHFLCWFILFLTSWIHHSKNLSYYIYFIEAFCCTYLFTTVFYRQCSKSGPIKNGRQMRKIVRNLENTYTDISDFEDISATSSEDLESSQESKANSVKLSPNHETKSVNSINFWPMTCPPSNPTVMSYPPSINLVPNTTPNLIKFSPIGLETGFNNLHLSRPKPVLSPPRFHNPWMSGGFARERLVMPVKSVSRCSSESSGFGSQHGFEGPEFCRNLPSPAFYQPNYMYQCENWSDRVFANRTVTGFRDLSLLSE